MLPVLDSQTATCFARGLLAALGNMKKALGYAVLVLTVTACVPMRMTYFKPSGNGKVFAGPCGGTPSTLQVQLPHGVRSGVDVVRSADQSLMATVAFYAPKGTSIRLVSGVMIVVDGVSGRRYELAPPTVRQQCRTESKSSACERNVPPTTPMEGATIGDGSLFGLGKADRGLFYHIDIPFVAKNLAIMPPEIEINGTLVRMNQINFNEQTSTEWAALCQ